MPASSTIAVRGLADLDRAFAYAGKQFSQELRSDLRDVAEPIRADAERRAVAEIRNIGPNWSLMRAVARRNLVYVAPVERGNRTKRNPRLRRPNLAGRLMNDAMQPALDANIGQVTERFELMVQHLGSNWEQV